MDSLFPNERFQYNQTIVTFKETETGGGLNLAVKRAKPNTGGAKSTSGPNMQKEVVLKKSEKKMMTVQ